MGPALLIAGGVLAVCLGLWGPMSQTHEDELARARQGAQLRAAHLAQAVGHGVDASLHSLDITLLHLRDLYRDQPQAFAAAARQMLAAYPRELLQGVAVYGSDGRGRLVATNVPGAAIPDDPELMRRLASAADRMDIGPMRQDGGGYAQALVLVSRPVLRDGRCVAAVSIALRPQALARQLAALQGRPEDALAVFRADGQAIAHSHLSQAQELRVPGDRAFLRQGQGDSGLLRTPSARDGRPLLLAWQRLARGSLVVVAAINEQQEYAPLLERQAHVRRRVGSLMALALCFGAGLTLLVYRLQRAEAHGTAMFQRSGLPMLLVDPVKGCIVEANDAAATFYGHDQLAMRSMPLERLLAVPGPAPAWHDGMRQCHRRADGAAREIEVRSGTLELGKRRLMYCVVQDVTERCAAEASAAAEADRLAALLDTASDGIHVLDEEGNLVLHSPSFTAMLGYDDEEARRLNVVDWDHDGTVQDMKEIVRLRMIEPRRFEARHRCKDGRVLEVEISSHGFSIDGRRYLYASSRDITERKAAEREVHRLAFYDPLTQLPNRRLLYDRLQHALAHAALTRRWGAALFIDLDDFKTLNDARGHGVGDLLLQQVARRLQGCLREEDMVARIGGDEFVVLLQNAGESEEETTGTARRVAGHIHATLAETYLLNGHAHHSTASIGIALFDAQGGGVDDILRRADLAMYDAKSRGRHGMRFFDPRMQAQAATRVRLEEELRTALQERQLLLHYQPQVDAQGRVCGAEALVRWQHPQRGLLAPGEFIEVAEAAGMINAVGAAVLHDACARLVLWAAQPELCELTLAVNVSALQFGEESFVDDVRRALRETGANPRRLELELTESALVADIDAVIAKMRALKAMGIALALDDFGTGYSSLSYLSRLPLDQLKIDRSFVKGIEVDRQADVICAATINLAHSLSLQVVAEGVETEAQRHRLTTVHPCDRMQGYLFGRPVPAAAFEAAARATAGTRTATAA